MQKILIVEDEFIVANDLERMLVKAGYHVCGIAESVSEAIELIETTRPSFILLDILLNEGSNGIDLGSILNDQQIGFIYISANTNQSILERAKATHPHGFLVKPFREKDLLIMLDIALERCAQTQQITLVKQRTFDTLTRKFRSSRDGLPVLIAELPMIIQELITFEYLKVEYSFRNSERPEQFHFIKKNIDDYQLLSRSELENLINGKSDSRFKDEKWPLSQGIRFLNGLEFKKELLEIAWDKHLSHYLKLNSSLRFSLPLEKGASVRVTFYSTESNGFPQSYAGLINKNEKIFKGLFMKINDAYHSAETPNTFSEERQLISNKSHLTENSIIGSSVLLRKVLEEVKIVAPTTVSIMIFGESGTGKEQIAKLIHHLSGRKLRPLVVLNCGAIPAELVESELFGHEKGAFTGASDRRVGKFEQAKGGTLFLDEIGELPLQAQVKLLRVLQEREFERVGGVKTLKTDVRIIAATNRNLEKEVAEGRFRLDLYYRLNVLPINVPPLRDRLDDIEPLVEYFLRKASQAVNRIVPKVSHKALEELKTYNWPGNIRELEHLVERSVLLSPGPEISEFSFLPNRQSEPTRRTPAQPPSLKTMAEVESAHIISTVHYCNGKIEGPGGAAEILGLSPSTLKSKLQRMGIKRGFHHNL